MSTKDRIPEEALSLFSEYGCGGTGIELIAESDRQPQAEQKITEIKSASSAAFAMCI